MLVQRALVSSWSRTVCSSHGHCVCDVPGRWRRWCSPGLSPTENLWDISASDSAKKHHCPRARWCPGSGLEGEPTQSAHSVFIQLSNGWWSTECHFVLSKLCICVQCVLNIHRNCFPSTCEDVPVYVICYVEMHHFHGCRIIDISIVLYCVGVPNLTDVLSVLDRSWWACNSVLRREPAICCIWMRLVPAWFPWLQQRLLYLARHRH